MGDKNLTGGCDPGLPPCVDDRGIFFGLRMDLMAGSK